MSEARKAVIECGELARDAAASLAGATGGVIDEALRGMADLLHERSPEVLAANAIDCREGEAAGLGRGLLDRLRLDAGRMADIATQIGLLADAPFPPESTPAASLPGGLRLAERRVPVGVIGANFEARPNVTVDIASQLLKSRNAGVLRTGGAALRSAAALFDQVIGPAVAAAGLDSGALQLVRSADREAATELVRQPSLIPLVILRGSGQSTAALAAEAARHGVRTLAHADGGGVLYADRAADPGMVVRLVTEGLDRLGVCNRLNLLLIDERVWQQTLNPVLAVLGDLGIRAALPPHEHPLGHEWALDSGNEATVTIAPAPGPAQAAALANTCTSGLAATIVTGDPDAARTFLAAYRGTGAFWNVSTRLLDGFKLRGVPETGINVDHVPGPRGPVTFHDLYLRQYVVVREDG
ncbi:MAG TPA: gamma-glutamyl phosphate reductase [Streptosporangiaceae bacterium]|nr:gamma-glutamyl phosphate reductase [Streptosporangiaceae bacterium]